jgi:hypothetical protein
MGGNKVLGGFRKAVDPWGLTGGENIFGGYTYGRPGGGDKKKKSGGGGKKGAGSASYDPMMAFMSQMQSDQAAQAEAARLAQQQALIEAQQQSALASARQGEMAAQQTLSQAGAMQQAKDIAALQAQQKSATAAGQAAVGGGFDIAKAQQEQAANLAGTGAIPSTKLPFYGMDDTSTTTPATRSANIFNLPKSSGLTFGGQ